MFGFSMFFGSSVIISDHSTILFFFSKNDIQYYSPLLALVIFY